MLKHRGVLLCCFLQELRVWRGGGGRVRTVRGDGDGEFGFRFGPFWTAAFALEWGICYRRVLRRWNGLVLELGG
jgi:hypothetical protein